MKRLLVFLILTAVYAPILAQTSEKYNSKYAGFYRGEELFEKEQYGAARKEFRDFINNHQHKNDPFYIKALYYEGISALELYNNDAIPLLEDFNKNYPESIYKNKIYFHLGRFYYQKKDYPESLVWFNKLKKFDVDKDELDEYNFKRGYAFFQTENFQEARNAFFDVKDSESQYGAPSLYFYSHIAYQEKSYQVALEGFQKLLQDKRFKDVVPYYITQIYYLQGKYDEVTKIAPTLIDSLKPKSVNNMNQLIGDAYFRIGKYDEAAIYLEKYNKKEKTTRDEDYQLAYAYYKTGNYERAIKLFDRVTKEKDSVSQIAYYQIAECYLKSKNNISARSAFEAASKLDFNSKIQEDALYNYAVLSYKIDINPYNEAVVALTEYLNRYPDSDRKSEVYSYLISVYTSTNRYEDALKSLDKIMLKDIRLKTAYQIVAFNFGVEQYQKGNYTKAIEAFKQVGKYPIDGEINAQATFWSADTYMQLKNYKNAISGFRDFLGLPANNIGNLRADAYYNLGYAYLYSDGNQASNSGVEDAFKNFLSNSKKSNKIKIADAYMRLGDFYYVTRRNDQAIENYQRALDLKAGGQDQALFYMALTYGLTEKGQEIKIKNLLDIVNNYPRSQYLLPSIYEIALTYRSRGQEDKALTYFEQLVRDYPNATMIADAKINIADIEFKKKNYEKSEKLYKKLLEEYPSDMEVCKAGVDGLSKIYSAQKSLDKIETLKVYKCSEEVVNSLEESYYNAGIEAYIDSSFTEAATDLQKYLDKFPDGKYVNEVTAYLGHSLYRTNHTDRAMIVYQKLLERPVSSFTELAAIRVSKYMYNNKEYEQALKYYTILEKTASNHEIIFNTRLGLMRCNFLLENWENAAEYARKVLENSSTASNIKLEAEYVRGVASYKQQDYKEAKPALEYVVKNTTTKMSPECKFYLAEMNYKQQDYAKSDQQVRELLKMKPAYDYWIAKALILQTKVLIAKEDLFQAEATLNSVLENYPVKDDGILLEGEQLMDELMQIKNMPKDVEEKRENIIDINENGK